MQKKKDIKGQLDNVSGQSENYRVDPVFCRSLTTIPEAGLLLTFCWVSPMANGAGDQWRATLWSSSALLHMSFSILIPSIQINHAESRGIDWQEILSWLYPLKPVYERSI